MESRGQEINPEENEFPSSSKTRYNSYFKYFFPAFKTSYFTAEFL
jgi:hypothetical protein